MSWKRIFKTARRLGSPVIVTDPDGKDPLVVMPLGAFEDLVDEDNFGEMGLELPDEFGVTGQDLSEDILEIPWDESSVETNGENLAKNKEKVTVKPMDETSPEVAESEPGISLEERFYFEPLEDDGKK
ncbi:MAG: hypothetical protein PHS79_03720 [Patescibacteria group bacterium]|nr:hypothetical protein [Patescibacteria group bacterium]